MSAPEDIYASDAAFERRAMEATGLTWADIEILAEAQEREEQERSHTAGHCCWAGAVASPGACAWHPAIAIDQGR